MEIDAKHPPESSPSSPKPHDILWYPDGDVVLSTDSYLFKVHKCILSVHSSVFRDMFAFPTVDGMETVGDEVGPKTEKYEGLPLVTLVDDKGEDVVHLLRTVYERRYYRRDDEETSLRKITALLVLSTKYDFKDIRMDAIYQISRQYPTTLDAYCNLDDDLQPLFGMERQACHWYFLLATLKADVDFLLPALYYACSDYDLVELCRCIESGNLDLQASLTLIKGRDQVRERTTTIIAKLPDILRKGKQEGLCKATTPCRKVAYFTKLDTFCTTTNLRAIRGEVIVKSLKNACEDCTEYVRSWIDKERSQIWEAIPLHFGFPSWNVLHTKKIEVLNPDEDQDEDEDEDEDLVQD